VEHRWGRRIALKIPVRLGLRSGKSLLAQMVNVSISGAFVQTPRHIRLWTQLEVEVILRHNHFGRNPERVVAHVTRQESDGVGIEWCDLAPRSVRVLLEATQAVSQAAPGATPTGT
jgi:hypothetical protein